MLLQVLRTLEGLAAEIALVRLERHMDADMRGNMITLDGGCLAIIPLTSEIQVVRALATNMFLAYVLLQNMCQFPTNSYRKKSMSHE